MKVNFAFSQNLTTAYPGLQIAFTFAGEALVNGDSVQIYRVFSDKNMGGHPLTIPSGYDAQNLAIGDMGRFLGECRDAARKAAYKLEKERKENDVADWESEPRNGGFMPNPNDIKYMNEDHE